MHARHACVQRDPVQLSPSHACWQVQKTVAEKRAMFGGKKDGIRSLNPTAAAQGWCAPHRLGRVVRVSPHLPCRPALAGGTHPSFGDAHAGSSSSSSGGDGDVAAILAARRKKVVMLYEALHKLAFVARSHADCVGAHVRKVRASAVCTRGCAVDTCVLSTLVARAPMRPHCVFE